MHLEHDSHQTGDRLPFGAAATGSSVFLRLRVLEGMNASLTAKVRLWTSGKGESYVPMEIEGTSFVAKVPMPQAATLLWYYFVITDGEKVWYYGNNEAHLGGEGRLYETEPPAYQITVYDQNTHTPDWFKNAIVYQIFPDRFRRGTKTTASAKGKAHAVLHTAWNDKPYYCKDQDTGEIVYYDFFGGNLAGIQEKFDYLKKLGVTVIYLNPIFLARSNHRYDTADYLQIDPLLGTNQEFETFCAAAKEQGIRIILDGVFSHTGADSRYFNQFGTYSDVGAYQSKDSPYYPWYQFNHYPDDFTAWWGVKDLPDVKEMTPSYLDFIIRRYDSVLKTWLRRGISGWRLDVIDELPEVFLQLFYRTLKKENPEAVLIGEVWEDASNKEAYGEQRTYLSGCDMDSAMNYPQRKIQLDFMLDHIDAARAEAELWNLREHYPKENYYAMLNLIGSHDVERVRTLLEQKGPEIDMTAEEAGKRRLYLLMAWQMTLPGAPCIYYGDEAGLRGGKDPDNRRTYPWGQEDADILLWTKKLTYLRTENPVLRTGRLLPLYAKGDVIVYARSIEGGKDVFGSDAPDGFFVVALNRSDKPQCVTVDTDGLAYGKLEDVLQKRTAIQVVNGHFTLDLQPLSVQILRGGETKEKRSGILLHPTSLPNPYGCGELDQHAFRFIDFLQAAGQKVWQILPLTPPLIGDSPYLSDSAFAMDTRLLSLESLWKEGLLSPSLWKEYTQKTALADSWGKAWQIKSQILWKMSHDPQLHIPWDAYEQFCQDNAAWLEDYALYKALTAFFTDKKWQEWPEDIKHHEKTALLSVHQELAGTVDHIKFVQYLLDRQWQAVHDYATQHGITLLGDIPMYVALDSADCWAHQELFDLDALGQPNHVAGVPPDYFSADGQLWGNPLYRYDVMEKDGYAWWKQRLQRVSRQVDAVRIDHFRGFAAYWAVPFGAKTAKEGQWVKGPGSEFLRTIQKTVALPMLAEDLGVITDDVSLLRQTFQLPGMKILQFHWKSRTDGEVSFDTEPRCVAYTGTHDNNTLRGWYEEELTAWQQRQIRSLLNLAEDAPLNDILQGRIQLLYTRRAETVILPMQDLLALPSGCRMNVPGTSQGNWHWQMQKDQIPPTLARWLNELAHKTKRA